MTSKVKYHFYSDGTVRSKIWINEEEQVHRGDGPAVEYSNGRREWYKNGKLHRENGPSLVWYEGSHSYYLNNKEYAKEEYWKEIEKIKKEREK